MLNPGPLWLPSVPPFFPTKPDWAQGLHWGSCKHGCSVTPPPTEILYLGLPVYQALCKAPRAPLSWGHITNTHTQAVWPLTTDWTSLNLSPHLSNREQHGIHCIRWSYGVHEMALMVDYLNPGTEGLSACWADLQGHEGPAAVCIRTPQMVQIRCLCTSQEDTWPRVDILVHHRVFGVYTWWALCTQ